MTDENLTDTIADVAQRLEKIEDELAFGDGEPENLRERLTDCRSDLVSAALSQEYQEQVEVADSGDILILDEAGSKVERREGGDFHDVLSEMLRRKRKRNLTIIGPHQPNDADD